MNTPSRLLANPPVLSQPMRMSDAFADTERFDRRVSQVFISPLHRNRFITTFADCLVLDTEGEDECIGSLWGAEVWADPHLSPDTVILAAA